MKSMLRGLIYPIIGFAAIVLFGRIIEVSSNQFVQQIVLYMGVSVILALSLNLVNGFTGQFSIGHAGFMGIGAYVSAYLGTAVIQTPGFFDFLWFAVAGGLAAAVAGYMVGLPSLRLRGDYLAIVTLGFGEIIRVVFLNTPAIGGARGLGGITRPPAIEMGDFIIEPLFLFHMHMAFWVVVTFVALWRLAHSVHGRTFLSVREDEIAAQAMGINTTQTKVRAFVISAFFTGVGGAVFAHSAQYLTPQTFDFTRSVDILIMVVLGGMGSLTGSAVAAVVITALQWFVLRPLADQIGIDLRMIIYPLMLIIFMIVRPQGIFGTHEITELFKRGRGERSNG